jgi:parvulin-like peptidyl-prolyl isomerase
MMQQGKELGMERSIEEEVNARFVQILKQQNIKSLDELYKQMRSEGVEPEDVKAMWRKEIVPEMVFNQAVDAKIYNGFTNPQLKEYFEKNKDKFRRPETVTLSEIFLSLAGNDVEAVRAKAADLVKQLRGGADFATLVEANSQREGTKRNKGKLNTFLVGELEKQEPILSAAIKDVKAGGVTDPVQIDEGIIVFRVDERTAPNATPVFDERRTREMMLIERRPAERKKYVAGLRDDAYIKISDSYRAAVEPLLSKADVKN